jgi:hypothetical protein
VHGMFDEVDHQQRSWPSPTLCRLQMSADSSQVTRVMLKRFTVPRLLAAVCSSVS